MALANEILGISYEDKTFDNTSEVDFHQLANTIFDKISTLNKWDKLTAQLPDDMIDNEDSEDELPSQPSLNSGEWIEDGMLNFHYGLLV